MTRFICAGASLGLLLTLSSVAAPEDFGRQSVSLLSHGYDGCAPLPSAPPAMAMRSTQRGRDDILTQAQRLMFARMRQINADNDMRQLCSSERLRKAHIENQQCLLSRKKRAVLCRGLIPLAGLALYTAISVNAPLRYYYGCGHKMVAPSETLHEQLIGISMLLVAGVCMRRLFSCLQQYWALPQQQEQVGDLLPQPLSPLERWSLEQQRDTLQFLLENPVGRAIADISSLAEHYAQRGEGAESAWSSIVRDCSLDRLLGFESADMVRALLRANAQRAQAPPYAYDE